MSKVAVVYWSSTGNTEAMANAVAEGAKAAGAEVVTFETADFTAEKVDEFDAIAFGCPRRFLQQMLVLRSVMEQNLQEKLRISRSGQMI